MFCQLFSLQNKSFLCLQHVENKGFQTVIKHRLKAIQKPIMNELGNREKIQKNAHFVLKKCTFRFRDYNSLTHSLRMIFSKNTVKDAARLSLARWYNKVDDSGFKSFNVIAATLYEHYDEVLNFFVNRATNAFAESFNAKIKAFRAALRGVTDIKFFLFRLTKLYA